ncbi:uncharacterized protein EI97DRAFT_471252 [Westerdykella ornata]|uniref:Uncharacterized protein n=1 Tax=Westerdykella ornata TaxID=318751 RepID=A0A6A6J846_WESOR|nr:uncharacterized protein EI97DRAFT_471252 [Westerdykella ornata]KAF2271379.1 hypothetical protein EI97DRAFT_471252 [Westerdykella ornata]
MASMAERIRMDLLYRLRWDLLADLHDIQIVVDTPNEGRPFVFNDSLAASVGESTGFGPTNHMPQERRIPLFDHSSAEEDLAVPGLSRIEVCSSECLDKYDLSYDQIPESDGYQPPPSLIIENKDGKSITLRQFVTQAHAYLNEHMDEINRALRATSIYGKQVDGATSLFFRRVWASGTDDNGIRLSVSLIPEGGWEDMDRFWAAPLNQARLRERSCGRCYRGFS